MSKTCRRKGEEFLLHEYLTITGSHPSKQTTPVSLNSSSYTCMWDYRRPCFHPFESKETIVHNNESIVTKIESEKLIEKFKEWKRSSDTRLVSNQEYLIDYNIQEIPKLMASTLRERVNLFVTAAIIFHKLKHS